MSEIKGSLLTIVLSITVFSVLFTVVTYAIKNSADKVADNLDSAVQYEADAELLAKPETNFKLIY